MATPFVPKSSNVHAFIVGTVNMKTDDTAEGFEFRAGYSTQVIERITAAHPEVRRDAVAGSGEMSGSAYSLAVEWDQKATDIGLMLALDNGVNADVVYGGMLPASGMEIGAQIGDYLRLNWNGGVNGHVWRSGDLSYNALSTPETAAGNTSGVNHGAATATQTSILQVAVLAFTGTSIAFNVEQAATDSWPGTDIFTDLSFTAAGHQQATSLGAIANTWRRITWAGTFTSATFYAAFATEP